MAVTAKLKLGFLEDAWDDAPEGDGGLRQKLRELEKAVRAGLSGGAITSLTANGRSHTYSNTGPTQQDIAEMWRELIMLHDKVAGQLDSTVDAEIYAEMVALLSTGGVTEWENDFSGVCR